MDGASSALEVMRHDELRHSDTARPNAWGDPRGLNPDPGTVLGSRLRATQYHLATYLNAISKPNQPRPQHEDEGALIGYDSSSARNEMHVTACRDLLQIDLVRLENILADFKKSSNRKVLRGQLFLWAIGLLKYTQDRSSSVLGVLLWTMATLAAGYGLFTVFNSGLVMRCSKSVRYVQRRLNAGQLGLWDRDALDGWWWTALEVITLISVP